MFNLKIIGAFKAILLTAGILLLFNTIMMILMSNFNSGSIFASIASVALLLYGAFFEMIYKAKWLRIGLNVVFAFIVSLIVFISIYGQADNVTYTEDAVVVLGAGIRGERVSLPLAYRLDKAAEYYSKNNNAVIVVSGGQGPQENITEALAMERYLIKKGIPKEKIIKEEKSTSTYTNLVNSKEILDGYFGESYKIALITNNFHIYRASRVARTVGFDCTHYHAKIEWYSVPINYLRECVAVVKVWIMGV